MSGAAYGALAARGVLAGVLAWSAIAKLRDRDATRAQLVAARLPASLDHTLPLVEAFTALGLVVERRTAWAAYVALGLCAIFTGYVAWRLARGDHAPCPCFGATSNRALGPETLARNVGLLALAVLGTVRAQHAHWVIWVVAVATLTMFATASRRRVRPARHDGPTTGASDARG